MSGDDAFEFVFPPRAGCRGPPIDRDALEGFGVLPAGGRTSDQPVTYGGIVRIERARLTRGARLRPVDPQTKPEPVTVGEGGDIPDTVRKLYRIRGPVTDAPKPTPIPMEKLQAQPGRVHHPATCP